MTPAARGFSMPPEWAPHRATWIAWPHNREDWPGKFEPVPWVFAEVVRHLHRRERVCILVRDPRAVESILRRAGVDLRRVELYRCPTDRVWTRDSGPTFVKRGGERLAVWWRFNGWAKYPDHKRDERVGAFIARMAGVPVYDNRRVVLEGGAIDVDGAGNLLATEECLLSKVQARNPGLGRAGTERALAEALGVRRVIWLGRGIVGDDTHGHVDDVCRFVASNRVVLAEERNPRDPNYRRLRENFERLRAAKVEVVPLPMPAPLYFDGQRLPASYLNFYIANGVVLVPTFNDPNDRLALGRLAELFPGREVIGIHAVDLVWGLGTLHCMTQQEPA